MFRANDARDRIRAMPVSTWVAVGASLMFLLDPDNGRSRRARLRDQIAHFVHREKVGARRVRSDLSNRLHGLRVQLRALWRPEEEVPDEILSARVRAKLGVFVSHPHAVEVRVHDGVVTVGGPILRREAATLMRRVRRMAGVRDLVDRLERHSPVEHVPALQGGVVRRRRPEILQDYWAPGVRFLAGAAGVGIASVGVSRRQRSLALVGTAVLVRALVNMPLRRMFASMRQVIRSRGRQPPLTTTGMPQASLGMGATPAPTLAAFEPIEGAPPVVEETPTDRELEVARSIRE